MAYLIVYFYQSTATAASQTMHPDEDVGDGLDADLARELPVPERRQKRCDAHMDRKALRELWYKGVPKLDGARKKRNRLVPENEFQFDKLEKGEIRLLSLHPHKTGEPTSPLVARLFTRRLDEVRGRYEALSYTWGDQNVRPREIIHIRNASHRLPSPDKEKGEKFNAQMLAAAAMRLKSYRFPIYENLHDALMRLRGALKPVIIWTDAICIDQSENGEREKRQQLMMMDEIYKSASNVCVWIGNGFRGSTEGMQLAREITNFQTFDKLIASGPLEPRWIELIRILKLPWFGRRWIIQEIALAREATVHCGLDRIHWDDFAETVSLLLDRVSLLRKSFRDEIFEDVEATRGFVLVAMLSIVCRKSDRGHVLAKTCDLETLVSTLLGFQATHPKDVIFSVISLARDPPMADEQWERDLHGEQLERLDKSKKNRQENVTTNSSDIENANSSMLFKYQLNTRDVFVAFVTRSIYNSGYLDIICRHWAPPVLDRYGQEVSMPSWVSPLARSPYGLVGTFKGRQNSDNLVAYSTGDLRKRYNAAGYSKADISMVEDQSPGFHTSHPVNTVRIQLPSAAVVSDAMVQSPAMILSSSKDLFDTAHAEVSVKAPVSTAADIDASNRPQLPEMVKIPGSRQRSMLQRQATSHLLDMERLHHLSGVLRVRGFVVGVVGQASDVMRGGIVPGQWVQKMGWGTNVDPESDSNRVPELLWRTLVADRDPRGGPPPPWYRRACLHALNDPRRTDTQGNLHSVTPPDRSISEHSTLYLRRVESVVWNRRLFLANLDPTITTATGLKGSLFGIGPTDTRLNDRICILLGCSVPVILTASKRKGLHRVVGEAYVYGIMDGEAVTATTTSVDFLLE